MKTPIRLLYLCEVVFDSYNDHIFTFLNKISIPNEIGFIQEQVVLRETIVNKINNPELGIENLNLSLQTNPNGEVFILLDNIPLIQIEGFSKIYGINLNYNNKIKIMELKGKKLIEILNS